MSQEFVEIEIEDLHQKYFISEIKCKKCSDRVTSGLKRKWPDARIEITDNLTVLNIHYKQTLSITEVHEGLLEIGKYKVTVWDNKNEAETVPQSKKGLLALITKLYPLYLIFSYIGVSVVLVGHHKGFTEMQHLNMFMGLFYIVFSFFKLLNLQGFVKTFTKYDPIAIVLPKYGYFYPWIEVLLGLAYLYSYQVLVADIATLTIFSLNLGGVSRSLYLGQELECACLGSMLKLPLTAVTIAEDLMMIIMAIIGLCISG